MQNGANPAPTILAMDDDSTKPTNSSTSDNPAPSVGEDTPTSNGESSEMVEFEITESNDSGTAYVAYPEGAGPFPGVLVLHEIFGLNEDMKVIARRFARNGYVAMAPDYFGPGFRVGCIVSALRSLQTGEGSTFDRLNAARSWLVDQDSVNAGQIGTVGFCMGGGFSVLHAAGSDVHVVAEFYGEVPKKAEALQGIPPCYGGFGSDDKLFGAKKAKVLKSHLDKLDVPNEVVVYDNVGHSFMSEMTATTGLMATVSAKGPMKVAYDPTAAEDSWSRMLAFFAEHLVN